VETKNREHTGGLPSNSLFLGIDGGGTKTIAWLGRGAGGCVEPVGAGQGGPSNPRAVGFEAAFLSIRQSVISAFENSRLPTSEIESACLCLAGTGRQEEKDAVLQWASQNGLARRINLVNEAEAVLAAVDSPRPTGCAEVALICGTGSLAWGRKSLGDRPVRSGGWGYLLGDEGSGYWLGQHIVQMACRVADGRSTDSAILASVLSELQLQSADQLVSWCYERPGGRERIARLARLAFPREADTNSDAAFCSHSAFQEDARHSLQQLVNRGAAELAHLVSSVVDRLGTERYTLAMAGSVLCHQTHYRRLVKQHLEQLSQVPASLHLVAQPVAGTLRLAAQFPEEP